MLHAVVCVNIGEAVEFHIQVKLGIIQIIYMAARKTEVAKDSDNLRPSLIYWKFWKSFIFCKTDQDN